VGAYAKYINLCQDISESGEYTARAMRELLIGLHQALKQLLSDELGWLDVAVPVFPTKADHSALLHPELHPEDGLWLKVRFSEHKRLHRPTLIPIEVRGAPWRGSGNAFLSEGLDYVGSFRRVYSGPESELPERVASQLEKRYELWRREAYFASLLSVAIEAPNELDPRPIGVLNLNFAVEYPLGTREELAPNTIAAINDLLEPALHLIGLAIEHSEEPAL
jgi:hypothetical protein